MAVGSVACRFILNPLKISMTEINAFPWVFMWGFKLSHYLKTGWVATGLFST